MATNHTSEISRFPDDFFRTLLQLPELSGLDIRQLVQNNNRSTKPLLMLNYSLGSPLIINLITPNLLTLLITNNAYVGMHLIIPCDSQIIALPMLLYYLSQFIWPPLETFSQSWVSFRMPRILTFHWPKIANVGTQAGSHSSSPSSTLEFRWNICRRIRSC